MCGNAWAIMACVRFLRFFSWYLLLRKVDRFVRRHSVSNIRVIYRAVYFFGFTRRLDADRLIWWPKSRCYGRFVYSDWSYHIGHSLPTQLSIGLIFVVLGTGLLKTNIWRDGLGQFCMCKRPPSWQCIHHIIWVLTLVIWSAMAFAVTWQVTRLSLGFWGRRLWDGYWTYSI